MKRYFFLSILLIASNVHAWDLKVVGGEPVCVQCESYDVYNATASTVNHVEIDSTPLTLVNQLKAEGFKSASRSAWLEKVNERMKETYIEKRVREYPSTGDQLDALWKIVTSKEDAQSDAVKKKIADVKAKYPKP